MDKQTAIDLLDNLLGMVEDNHESDYDAALHMGIDAIKALPSVQPETEERTAESAQNVPNDELISKKAAIDAVQNAFDKETILNSFVRKVAIDALKALSSVQPQRWIPVTERLPRDDEDVIVTCLDDSGDTPYSYTTVAWHYKGMWVCENERCPFVVGWMPLPTSYKEDEDAKN